MGLVTQEVLEAPEAQSSQVIHAFPRCPFLQGAQEVQVILLSLGTLEVQVPLGNQAGLEIPDRLSLLRCPVVLVLLLDPLAQLDLQDHPNQEDPIPPFHLVDRGNLFPL